MLERWKKQLFSEDGMKVVNVMFILLYLVRNPLFTICAYTVWFCLFGIFCEEYKK